MKGLDEKKANTIPTINIVKTGKRIEMLRVKNQYSVRQLTEIFGFSSGQAIYNWQKGKALPTIDNFLILAKLFGVTVEEILVTEEVECTAMENVVYPFVS